MSKQQFLGIKTMTKAGFDAEQTKQNGIIYLVRDSEDSSDGFIYLDGKKYGTGNNKEDKKNKIPLWKGTLTGDEYPTALLVKQSLDGKANTGHTHDDRYYTESEVDEKLDVKENISNKVTTLTSGVTDTQYPSAKAVNDVIKENEEIVSTALNELNGKISGLANDAELKVNKVAVITSGLTDEQYPSAKAVYEFIIRRGSDDLSHYDAHGNLSLFCNTANCYIVRNRGTYKLPLVYGNGIKNDIWNSNAFTQITGTYTAPFYNYLDMPIVSPFIEDDTQTAASAPVLIWQDCQGMLSNLELIDDTMCRYLCFTVNSIPETAGNAIIGIKDAQGRTMWSWHIWVIDDNLAPVEITNHSDVKYSILPYNLGTTFDDAQRTHMKNVFYQWGRKDPMPTPAAYNSNTNKTLWGDEGYSTKPAGTDETVGLSIQKPNLFFLGQADNKYNWNTLPYFYNYWDANCTSAGASNNNTVKTIYDPSPVGYKVGNGRLFDGFTTTGSDGWDLSEFNVVGSFANGWYFKRNSSDTVGAFFPASGYRSSRSGSLYSVGSDGSVWDSAASSAAYAYYLGFYSDSVDPLNINNRANAFSVRSFSE